MTAARIEEARRLLRIASADLDACIALLNALGIRFANAAFHGQQAAEKSLKAVLTLRGADFGRTHNHVALVGQLAEADEQAPVSTEQLSLLNPYAITLRYDDIDFDSELVSPQASRCSPCRRGLN
ncbi:HEPN domain-containing protein [Propionivibrio sp.]|uniref:HEPN domain-containing protein n=1 Tax=Propionivibrio sp. TaxID=2212460 RepID=UPI003BF0224D